jgi:hypothetical protein
LMVHICGLGAGLHVDGLGWGIHETSMDWVGEAAAVLSLE